MGRVVLAGESPVRVSAGAPGSRLQPGGEIRPCRAECQKPRSSGEQTGGPQRMSERNSLVKLSAERCSGGPSRYYHGEGNRQHPGPERVLDLLGVSGGGTSGRNSVERERPYLAAGSGKDRAYKAEAESARSREGVREAHSTKEGVQDNALEGRGLALIMLGRR